MEEKGLSEIPPPKKKTKTNVVKKTCEKKYCAYWRLLGLFLSVFTVNKPNPHGN